LVIYGYDCTTKGGCKKLSALRIQEIWIYPVKSLAGFRCTEALALEKGFALDRRWMLIDANNHFLTQRQHPEMALFVTAYTGGLLHITHRKTGATLQFEPSLKSATTLDAKIWNDTVAVAEVDAEISQWFTRQLGFPCRLVSFPEAHPRPINPLDYPNQHVSLADAYPYLIIGKASLDALNSRLQEPMAMKRFRPNIVFSGGQPFAEDTWKQFTAGPVCFEAVKRCARCVLTTVNPETGIRGKEPLKTLATFRKEGNNIFFGINAIIHRTGIIRENDPINLLAEEAIS
jgi:uncharacterized protein YcbX